MSSYPATSVLKADGEGFLQTLEPLQVFAWTAGTGMAVIAAALWVASMHTDRLALRLFALRYALAALGWYFVHPDTDSTTQALPFPSMAVAVGLLLLSAFALDVYLGRTNRLRLLAQVVAAFAVLVALWAHNRLMPQDPSGIYLVMASAMGWLAYLAWRAADAERNAGHRLVAGAFLSYPIFVLMAQAGWPPLLSRLELGYVVALPSFVVGVAILLASLIRFGRRLEIELAQREAAERQVRELNASLEHRVAERTAELQQIVQGLEAFTRNVTHDLSGPLAGVADVARLAQDALARGDTARAQRMLAPLAPQAQRLGALVQDLLLLSRVSSEPCVREVQPLARIVDAALEQLAMSPDTAEVIGQVQVVQEELPELAVDGGLMQQVYVNLLGNALRFAAAGGSKPFVRVGVERSAAGLILVVADNGPGFQPDKAAALFEPFVRLHGQGLSRNGVGLSIVRRIIEHHGGRIWAEGAPQGGATFRFTVAD